MTTVYVPRDSAARSVGADDVAAALATALPDARIVRNGSRGMLWLEPLVEVVTSHGRVAYGPVTVDDVPSLAAALPDASDHALRLGVTDDLPWLASQTRLTFARVGIVDPLDPDDFVAHGGLGGLRRAVEIGSAASVEAVLASGLRGRGGAGFPAGIKWRTVAQADAAQKYVCINADEGDSGTYADRMLIEGDPFTLIEGMAIAGLSVGATDRLRLRPLGVPRRGRDPRARPSGLARERGWLGPDVLGSGRAFDIHLRVGAGSYVCGEETAMLESLEGRRGMVRAKPPLPALEGLFGMPTLINNVLTVAAVPSILEHGAEAYASLGSGRSLGTQVFQLAGNVRQGGIVETAFGVTLRELVEGYGGGTLSGRPLRAVQLGGPLGAYLPAGALDVAMDYEAVAEVGGDAGSRRHRRLRRHRRHGAAGPVRDGVLRRGVLRQVHAVPDRLGPRRRGDRPHPRRASRPT